MAPASDETKALIDLLRALDFAPSSPYYSQCLLFAQKGLHQHSFPDLNEHQILRSFNGITQKLRIVGMESKANQLNASLRQLIPELEYDERTKECHLSLRWQYKTMRDPLAIVSLLLALSDRPTDFRSEDIEFVPFQQTKKPLNEKELYEFIINEEPLQGEHWQIATEVESESDEGDWEPVELSDSESETSLKDPFAHLTVAETPLSFPTRPVPMNPYWRRDQPEIDWFAPLIIPKHEVLPSTEIDNLVDHNSVIVTEWEFIQDSLLLISTGKSTLYKVKDTEILPNNVKMVSLQQSTLRQCLNEMAAFTRQFSSLTKFVTEQRQQLHLKGPVYASCFHQLDQRVVQLKESVTLHHCTTLLQWLNVFNKSQEQFIQLAALMKRMMGCKTDASLLDSLIEWEKFDVSLQMRAYFHQLEQWLLRGKQGSHFFVQKYQLEPSLVPHCFSQQVANLLLTAGNNLHELRRVDATLDEATIQSNLNDWIRLLESRSLDATESFFASVSQWTLLVERELFSYYKQDLFSHWNKLVAWLFMDSRFSSALALSLSKNNLIIDQIVQQWHEYLVLENILEDGFHVSLKQVNRSHSIGEQIMRSIQWHWPRLSEPLDSFNLIFASYDCASPLVLRILFVKSCLVHQRQLSSWRYLKIINGLLDYVGFALGSMSIQVDTLPEAALAMKNHSDKVKRWLLLDDKTWRPLLNAVLSLLSLAEKSTKAREDEQTKLFQQFMDSKRFLGQVIASLLSSYGMRLWYLDLLRLLLDA